MTGDVLKKLLNLNGKTAGSYKILNELQLSTLDSGQIQHPDFVIELRIEIRDAKEGKGPDLIEESVRENRHGMARKVPAFENSRRNGRYLIPVASRAVVFPQIGTVAQFVGISFGNAHPTAGAAEVLLRDQLLSAEIETFSVCTFNFYENNQRIP